jgi:hypothetical protein
MTTTPAADAIDMSMIGIGIVCALISLACIEVASLLYGLADHQERRR